MLETIAMDTYEVLKMGMHNIIMHAAVGRVGMATC